MSGNAKANGDVHHLDHFVVAVMGRTGPRNSTPRCSERAL